VSQKQESFCPCFRQILTDFQSSFTRTLNGKFAIKRSLQIQPHVKDDAHYLAKYFFRNCTNRKVQQPGAHTPKRMWPRYRWAGTKPTRPVTDSSFNIPNSTIWFHIFTAVLVWSVLRKKSLLKNWLKQTAMRELSRSKQLLNYVIFVWFSDKKVFTPKNSHNNWLYVHLLRWRGKTGEKTLYSHRATVTDGVLKLGYTSVIFVDLGVKIDGTYYCDLLFSQQSYCHDTSGL